MSRAATKPAAAGTDAEAACEMTDEDVVEADLAALSRRLSMCRQHTARPFEAVPASAWRSRGRRLEEIVLQALDEEVTAYRAARGGAYATALYGDN